MTAAGSPTMQTAGQSLTIEREFEAPRVRVWKAWTDSDQFKRWYGPARMTAHVCEIDLRVGGRRLIGMQGPDGSVYYTSGVYREIVPLERFVATEAQCDASGIVMAGAPETILTVSLEDLGNGRTKLTLVHAGLPSEDWATGAGRGWSHALDTLEATLGGS